MKKPRVAVVTKREDLVRGYCARAFSKEHIRSIAQANSYVIKGSVKMISPSARCKLSRAFTKGLELGSTA